MAFSPQKITIIGAGINGLVAANYLAREGHQITLLERKPRVGGACVSEIAEVQGIQQAYALGASTLGLMQDFVWHETGLAQHLKIWAPSHPDIVFFPNIAQPALIYQDISRLTQELFKKWGERGDVAAYYTDQERVVRFLQAGYRAGRPPSVPDTIEALGEELTSLWVTGTAQALLDHYFTSEYMKLYLAQNVSESGPVSLSEPGSAFTIPMMSSGSVFGGDYGYVYGGIWQITQKLGQINRELGVDLILSCNVHEVDLQNGVIHYDTFSNMQTIHSDHVVFGTDPQTAARLTGDAGLIEVTEHEQILGSSGKLNLMFSQPVRWRKGSAAAEFDTAFRYFFAVDSISDFEAATMSVLNGEEFVPGFFQVYCEGASMRQMGLNEPFDRLTVFFKNLALGQTGEQLTEVETEVREIILANIINAEDCAWSRLLTPRDLQQTFQFPGGNIEHTMLVSGQIYHDRRYSKGVKQRFYQFGSFENASICGSSTYPCGSVAGTPGYMCARELLRHL